jgi:hypothetical protein
MSWVGDCWLEKQIVNIVNLLKEYQYVFTWHYKYLKGIVEEMGEMKIELIPRENPIKRWPYKLSHKYQLIIHK